MDDLHRLIGEELNRIEYKREYFVTYGCSRSAIDLLRTKFPPQTTLVSSVLTRVLADNLLHLLDPPDTVIGRVAVNMTVSFPAIQIINKFDNKSRIAQSVVASLIAFDPLEKKNDPVYRIIEEEITNTNRVTGQLNVRLTKEMHNYLFFNLRRSKNKVIARLIENIYNNHPCTWDNLVTKYSNSSSKKSNTIYSKTMTLKVEKNTLENINKVPNLSNVVRGLMLEIRSYSQNSGLKRK